LLWCKETRTVKLLEFFEQEVKEKEAAKLSIEHEAEAHWDA
jgi:hypothetical protein